MANGLRNVETRDLVKRIVYAWESSTIKGVAKGERKSKWLGRECRLKRGILVFFNVE